LPRRQWARRLPPPARRLPEGCPAEEGRRQEGSGQEGRAQGRQAQVIAP
jgi:hypothetical protein